MSAQMPAVQTPDPCDHRTQSAPVVIRTIHGDWYTARWTVYADQDDDGIPPCWELVGRDGLQLDPEEVAEWFHPGEVADLVATGNRVIAAFRALGEADGIVPNIHAHRECEAAMLALNASLLGAQGGVE